MVDEATYLMFCTHTRMSWDKQGWYCATLRSFSVLGSLRRSRAESDHHTDSQTPRQRLRLILECGGVLTYRYRR